MNFMPIWVCILVEKLLVMAFFRILNTLYILRLLLIGFKIGRSWFSRVLTWKPFLSIFWKLGWTRLLKLSHHSFLFCLLWAWKVLFLGVTLAFIFFLEFFRCRITIFNYFVMFFFHCVSFLNRDPILPSHCRCGSFFDFGRFGDNFMLSCYNMLIFFIKTLSFFVFFLLFRSWLWLPVDCSFIYSFWSYMLLGLFNRFLLFFSSLLIFDFSLIIFFILKRFLFLRLINLVWLLLRWIQIVVFLIEWPRLGIRLWLGLSLNFQNINNCILVFKCFGILFIYLLSTTILLILLWFFTLILLNLWFSLQLLLFVYLLVFLVALVVFFRLATLLTVLHRELFVWSLIKISIFPLFLFILTLNFLLLNFWFLVWVKPATKVLLSWRLHVLVSWIYQVVWWPILYSLADITKCVSILIWIRIIILIVGLPFILSRISFWIPISILPLFIGIRLLRGR